MSVPLDRVKSNVHACAIEIAFTGIANPSVIEGWQPFYNSIFEASDFQKAYASLSSIDFGEESATTAAGTYWKQKASFRFPENDEYRSERIALLHKIKFVKFKFTNGRDLIIGRNDFNQNTLPSIKNASDGQLCQIDVESQSIFPSGFTPNPNTYGLPTFIPLSLV